MTSSGSMPLPNDFDILRCFVSRAMPCRYTVWIRRLAHELEARHDHARDPEEQDVGAAHEHVRRVERAQVRRVLRPAERRERPEPGREPRVEHVLVLPHGAAAGRAVRHVIAAHGDAAARIAVPHRNAMPPPELPRDVPVANGLEPVDVHAFPPLGHECGCGRRARLRAPARRAASSSRTTGRTGAARPPCRSDSSAAPRAGAAPPSPSAPASLSIATMRSRASKRSMPRKLRRHALDGLAGLTRVARRLLAHRTRRGEHHRHRKLVTLADLEIVRVVRRRDLHGAGPERRIGVAVGDDRDLDVRRSAAPPCAR